MIILILILLIVGVVLRAYSIEHVLDRIVYKISPSKSVVEPGEDFLITSVLQNNKWLPVTFLRVSEVLPLSLKLQGTELAYKKENEISRLNITTYLMPFQKFAREYHATLPKRGRYFLRGATIYGGDFLGLSEISKQIDLAEEIVVLPESFQSAKLDKIMGDFLGDMSTNRFIMEDPILTLGFREYTGREPMKQISWEQSLKNRTLMVKNYDYTFETSATVALNVECGANGDKISSNEIELCYSVARYVCEVLESKKIKYSFETNATAAGAIGKWHSIPEGLGARHFYTICEGLGRATYQPNERFDTVLRRSARKAEQGRAHIIITPQRQEYWQKAAAEIKARTNAELQIIGVSDFLKPDKQEAGA